MIDQVLLQIRTIILRYQSVGEWSKAGCQPVNMTVLRDHLLQTRMGGFGAGAGLGGEGNLGAPEGDGLGLLQAD